MHTDNPVAALYVPAIHLSHMEAPLTATNVPTAQPRHVEAAVAPVAAL